jgi:RecB family exonuclease
MQTFLQQLTDTLQKEYGEDLSELDLVFPTRRAGLFFKQELASRATKPFWAPNVITIQDFIEGLSDLSIPDPVSLQFSLFKIYKNYFPAESFDRFYPWGELMLQDFSDIDRYMADASKVFSVVNDLREIEQEFQLDEEELEKLKRFWMSYFSKDPSRLKTEFINTWKHLGSMYFDFKKFLLDQNMAYEGLAFRHVAEKVQSGQVKDSSASKNLVFAGFYALTKTEEVILQHFIANHSARIFWDADSYYVDSSHQEAGTFFRKGNLVKEEFRWKMQHFADHEKEIEVLGIPLLVGQAKYTGELLTEMMKNTGFRAERTALVLPDENLLFPVLYSLPEDLKDINVTMGYPLRVTPLYHLFESLVNLRKNQRNEKDGKHSYYYRDVLNILNHPYIRMVAPRPVQKWTTEYNRMRSIRIESDQFSSHTAELFSVIFSELKGVNDIFKWLKEILQMILVAMKDQDFKFHLLESEFVVQFYTHLSRLDDAIAKEDINLELETSWFLFREIIQSVKIPFTGEPLKGLQVMGFLETRVLDFDHVILLSVNEDVLPASGNKPSFIPFNIRKAFGLPTFEDQHAVSAYHFYRLLQRAKKVHLLYNTESKAIAGGEKSRFLLQLEHELSTAFPGKIKFTEKVISTAFSQEKTGAISIEKTEEIIKDLERYLGNDSIVDQEKYSSKFSASALNTYISCPFKFYLRYLAGLKEQEETQEYLEAAGFGSILHHAMQLIYADQIELSSASFKTIELKLDESLDAAIKEELRTERRLTGKNLLLRNVLKELIIKILKNDKQDAPFKLMALEKNVFREIEINKGKKVQLYGIVDRVDEQKGRVRILDYKTGRVNKRNAPGIDELYSDPAFKEQFQATLYAYIMKKDLPDKTICSGLVTLRDMSKGIWYLNDEEPFSDETLTEFEHRLKKLLNEIFDPAIPFVQTEDEDRCKYCPYKGICNRE